MQFTDILNEFLGFNFAIMLISISNSTLILIVSFIINAFVIHPSYSSNENLTTGLEETDDDQSKESQRSVKEKYSRKSPDSFSSSEERSADTKNYCTFTKLSFENINFDYTWRIAEFGIYLDYVRKFRNEFEIKRSNFKLGTRDKFPGNWTIILSDSNLKLKYEEHEDSEPSTKQEQLKLVCLLEIVLANSSSELIEFKHSFFRNFRNYEDEKCREEEDCCVLAQNNQAQPQSRRLITILEWPNFGELLLEKISRRIYLLSTSSIENPKEEVGDVELIFHLQTYRPKHEEDSTKMTDSSCTDFI